VDSLPLRIAQTLLTSTAVKEWSRN